MDKRIFLLILAPLTAWSLTACSQSPAFRWQALAPQPSLSVALAARNCEVEIEQRLLSMEPAESPVFIFGTTTAEAGLWGRVRRQELFDECMAANGWARKPMRA